MTMKSNLQLRIALEPWSVLLALLTIWLGAGVGAYTSYIQARNEAENQAMFIAREVLQRGELISEQIQQAFEKLDASGEKDPCGPINREIMRESNISSSYLQLIGYVRDDRLLCSSYGEHGEGIDIGKATFTSPSGYAIRTGATFSLGGSATYVASTELSTGFTAFLLPNLTLDVARFDRALSLGLYGSTNGLSILHRGNEARQWLRTTLARGGESTFLTNSHVLALVRSERFEYTSYCALPISRLYGAWRQYAYFHVFCGALVGLVLSMAAMLLASRRAGLRYQLREAIKSGSQLYMLYQPIVELGTERWVGAESLVRWRQSEGHVITPDVFIPMAELTGLMPGLTAKVIEMVAWDAAPLLLRHPHFHININFAASDLESTASLNLLCAQLEKFGIDKKRVTVEVTEGSLLKIEQARHTMNLVREHGLKLAIDDFGTGYCGLSYLVSLKLDFLKIDKSFVDTIGTDAAARSVIPHIVQMAETLGLEVVAEGVETREQVEYLKQQGVKYAQGWLFSKPMSAAVLGRKLATEV